MELYVNGKPPPRFAGHLDLAAIWQDIYCREVAVLRDSNSHAAIHVITPQGEHHGDDAIHYRAATTADAFVERARRWNAAARKAESEEVARLHRNAPPAEWVAVAPPPGDAHGDGQQEPRR